MPLYNKKDAIKAQTEFCERFQLPLFMPEDGRCFSCRNNIFLQLNEKGAISVESAGETHITGCPFCNKSYCD
jgi:uncharacterized protein with PIN domain